MANLDNLIRWHEYAPDLGENRRLAKPFTVLLAVGLTKPDLQRLAEAVDELEAPYRPGPDATPGQVAELREKSTTLEAIEARAEGLAKALGPYVRLGAEPLSVAGDVIDSLPKLLKLYARIAGGAVAVLELAVALRHFNGAGGQTQLFFERLSGGSVSTDSTSRAAR